MAENKPWCKDKCAIPYTNNTIVDQRKYQGLRPGPRGMIQASGHFILGTNLFKPGNNQTGRGYYANGNGYWNLAQEQFNPESISENNNIGALYPNEKGLHTARPQMTRIMPYLRIGEHYRNTSI